VAFARGRKGSKKKDKRNGVKRKHNNIPDKIDIELWKEKIEILSKSLDENGKPNPLTENQLKQIIREGVREKWMYSKAKLAFLEKTKIPSYDPDCRKRFVWECNKCKHLFGANEINVDHINQEESFKSLEDAHLWASSLLNSGGDDLQILCIPDHKIKTHCDSTGLSWEDAVIDKQAIAWEDTKIKHQQFLMDIGFSKQETSNKKKRREVYIRYIKALQNS